MSERSRILVVEDDESIRLGLVAALEHAGFEVRAVETGEEALALVGGWLPDLVVLDVMLPGIDGIEVLARLKARHATMPVLLLTARDAESDRVGGLEAGADDYVTKPFSVRELVARIRARLRERAARRPEDTFAFGHCTVDLRRRRLLRGGEEVPLTPHEAGVLAYLIAHRGRDVTREELLVHVWGYSPRMRTRTVDNQILNLRKKIEPEPSRPRHILTVHGVGYRFVP